MNTLFILLFLLSIAGLALGLIKPRWVRMPSRKRAAMIFGAGALVSFVILGVILPNPPASNTTPPAAQTQEIATTTKPTKAAAAPTKTPVTAPAPAPQKQTDPTVAARQQLEQLVYDAVHGTNANNQPYIRSIDLTQALDATNPSKPDGSPNYTRWTVDVNLNIDGSKTLMENQMAEILYSLYSHRQDLYTVEIGSYEPVIDKYGNKSDIEVYHAFLNGSDAYKVNWNLDKDTLVYQVIPGLWTVNIDLSAINPNLLSK